MIFQFPDVIYLGDGYYQIVTQKAREWIVSETTGCELVDDIAVIEGEDVIPLMKLDLTVRVGPSVPLDQAANQPQ